MVRWLTGVMIVLPLVLLVPLLDGCVEPEPLYCDEEHPCRQLGYSCMYTRRTCIFTGDKDSGPGDSKTGEADQVVPDTRDADLLLPDLLPDLLSDLLSDQVPSVIDSLGDSAQ